MESVVERFLNAPWAHQSRLAVITRPVQRRRVPPLAIDPPELWVRGRVRGSRLGAGLGRERRR